MPTLKVVYLQDQYGGGTLIWGAGTYKNIRIDGNGKLIPFKEQIEKAHITIELKGKKLKGVISLIQVQKENDEKWFLKKVDDKEADARKNPKGTENKSVLTGRTMIQIKKDSQ